jgi:hypothetical protein
MQTENKLTHFTFLCFYSHFPLGMLLQYYMLTQTQFRSLPYGFTYLKKLYTTHKGDVWIYRQSDESGIFVYKITKVQKIPKCHTTGLTNTRAHLIE